ncbi:MAG: ABC transporter ATP-binding protein [Micrococcales bacterium]|nr:ABC transporter ATP-binding protein [Micrococcales bacterium]
MSANAVEVRSVSKTFRIYHEKNKTLKSALMRGRRSRYEEFRALDGVDLDIPVGSAFALVGNNGSGKSTLLKCIAKILQPDSGTIVRDGRIAALLEVGSGFHPELSGRDNIYLNGSILGMSRREIDAKLDEIVDFSGVERFIDQPVKNYSSGMYVRLGFSVAIHVEPDILLVDEVLAVGDAEFQDRCGAKFSQLRHEGRTVVLVSHALPQVRAMATQAVWLDAGKAVEVGDAAPVLDAYENFSHSSSSVEIDGLSHIGVGGVRVVRASLRGADGRAGVAVVGEAAVVTVEYVAESRFETPIMGLAVESANGTYLAATNTRDTGAHVDVVEEGRFRFEIRLPEIFLHPGAYTLNAGVVDASAATRIDLVRGIAQFSVENGGKTWSGGLLALPAQWSGPLPAEGTTDGE